MQPRFFFVLLILLAVILCVLLIVKKLGEKNADPEVTPTPVPTATPAPTATPDPPLPSDLSVSRADSANPSKFGFTSDIVNEGDSVKSYTRSDKLSFGRDGEYAQINGVLTFGGNNYRNSFAFGSVSVSEKRLRELWNKSIGAIGSWSGTGWTGQPLIVEWPAETVAVMNVKDSFKEAQTSLVEVIYPAMDGAIYFIDLATGSNTRDPIQTGVVQKGTSCIDPRGYPLLYVGQSIPVANDEGNNAAYVRIYSLISGAELARVGGFDWFARRTWQAYDGSPIIANDTMVYGGENGVLYTVKLNAAFDLAAGTVTVNPNRPVKLRYEGTGYSRTDAVGSRWFGIESSVAAFRNYAFFSDNGGRLVCVDLNKMEIKYVVDLVDESDATAVIEECYEDNTFYLYTGSQVRVPNGDIGGAYGYAYMRKINGLTGGIAWEKKWICSTGDANSGGGIVSTAHVGKGQIDNLVIYSISLAALSGTADASVTPSASGDAALESQAVPVPDTTGAYTLGGRIVALDKNTGEIVWYKEQSANYWASPVVVYDALGKAYLLMCDRSGIITLYDASDGTQYNTLDLGSRIDSTPAVFNDMLVVGTRGKGGAGKAAKISCVKIS